MSDTPTREPVELVALWTPDGEPNWMAFPIGRWKDLVDEIEMWRDEFDGSGVVGPVGLVKIEYRPAGWIESLPEHGGW